MGDWNSFYNFWISQQTVPGNILGDVLIGAATFVIGKYKVAPWLHARHKERMAQQERQHQEILGEHPKLFALHEKQHAEVLAEHAKLLELSQAQHQQLLELAGSTPTRRPSEPAPINHAGV